MRYKTVPSGSRRCQRDGTVTFSGVHAIDADLRIEVSERAGSAYSESFRAAADQKVAAMIRVARPGSVRGRLLDAKGQRCPLAA